MMLVIIIKTLCIICNVMLPMILLLIVCMCNTSYVCYTSCMTNSIYRNLIFESVKSMKPGKNDGFDGLVLGFQVAPSMTVDLSYIDHYVCVLC